MNGKLLAGVVVVLVVAAGAWFKLRPNSPASAEATLAPPRVCGPEAPDEDGLKMFLRPGASPELARAAAAVPAVMRRAFERSAVKLALGATAELPPGCRPGARVDGGASAGEGACLVMNALDGELLLLYGETPADRTRVAQGLLLPAVAGVFASRMLPRGFEVVLPAGAVDPAEALDAWRGDLVQAIAAEPGVSAAAAWRRGATWARDARSRDEVFAWATAEYYCSGASNAALKRDHPGVYAKFAATFACVLGRAWFDKGAGAGCG